MRSIRRSSVPTHRTARRALAVAAVLGTVVATDLVTAGASDAVSGGRAPVARMSNVAQDGNGFTVRGWAYDPDTSAPVTVKVNVDGKVVYAGTANLPRPDVAKSRPQAGPNRGYVIHRNLGPGTHRLCTYVVNTPGSSNYPIGCRTLVITHNPIGAMPWLTATPGFIRVTGWAMDPDDPTHARTVAVRIDNKEAARTQADRGYPKLQLSHPVSGNLHGFSLTVPIAEGTHSICMKVANVGSGVNTIVQCATRTINYSPTGKISTLTQVPGGFTMTGYASDPDTTAPINVTTTVDGAAVGTVAAADQAGTPAGHGFHVRYLLPGTSVAPGPHTICAFGVNAGSYGTSRNVQCVVHSFNFNPSVGIAQVTQNSPGATITGWATDPDTTAPVKVSIYADGTKVAKVTADQTGSSLSGHRFTATVPLADGKHTLCVSATNVSYGSGNSPLKCATVTLAFEPYGAFESTARAAGSTNVVATGWAIDPDTTAAIPVQVTVDSGAPVSGTANVSRPDVAKQHPGTGTAHGFAVSVPASDGEHTVCVQAVNVQGGSGTTPLGCKIVNAVHPKVPTVPTAVGAIAGYGGARVVWTAPASDGGAPWTSYTITAAPGGNRTTVAAGINAATLLGLKPSTNYTFSVVANNVAGASLAGTSPAVTTEKEPPAQTSPAPISTSRYIRNIRGGSATDLATMKREGAADAKANPSGHGYLSVLDLGGQDESRHGFILSAGIRFVSYTDMVKNLNAYVDGYASQQRPSAPVTIAIATNNDIDVWRGSGVNFANQVIDPVLAHAARYPGITIAGSDDMEPGFRASYNSTKAWLQGFLSASTAPFVFTGSADGCAWGVTDRNCNNGWSMRGLFYLAGGASSIRIINLPQVYNSTMAQQWRYISLTGVQLGQPKINFGGALTEWTACNQAGSCGSLTGVSAWKQMWNQLRAEPRLKPASLPYSTDLRIDS